MSAVAGPPRLRHPVALVIGLVLLVPQVVLAVLVLRNPILVGLSGFAMTIGFIRLGTLIYRVARERTPPVYRGLLAIVGLVATVIGGLLYAPLSAAAASLADTRYAALVAPAPAIGLNLLLIATLGLWLCGVVVLVASALGAIAGARRSTA